MTIRPYEGGDRAQVRTLCCETADKGHPVERFFVDREIFADVVTRYYTDFEPHSSWIVSKEKDVVGYLTGCLNTSRYQKVMRWRILPSVFIRSVVRGLFFRPEVWRLLKAGLVTWRWSDRRPLHSLKKYPAHLHINLSAGARGQHVGRSLLEKFIDQVRNAGLPGIHLVTRSDNIRACRFFESVGFSELTRYPVALPDGEKLLFHEAVVYGKMLKGPES